MTDLAVPASVELATLRDQAADHAVEAQAEATIRAYRSDWTCFSKWCASRGFESLPAAPETVALYITDLAARRKTATVSRRLTTITRAHAEAGQPTPVKHVVVDQVWRGIRRHYGTAKVGKAPAVTDELRAMVSTLDLDRLIGVRNRALLVIGFAGAFRRSEVVRFDVEHLADRKDGLATQLWWSKTNQEGDLEEVGLPYGSDPLTCPVRAYRDWLDASGITEGPIFRPVTRHGRMGDRRLEPRAVARVVKACARAAGLDPDLYAGHSLRAGLITSAAEAGVLERDIMRHSRHKSIPVMRKYIRGATLFKDNAAAAVGL